MAMLRAPCCSNTGAVFLLQNPLPFSTSSLISLSPCTTSCSTCFVKVPFGSDASNCYAAKRVLFTAPILAFKTNKIPATTDQMVVVHHEETADEEEEEIMGKEQVPSTHDTLLYSFTPLPFLLLGALPGAGTVRSLFSPAIELVKSLNLPTWLVHWGHPGNMAVVLFAMGGYGTYLGFRIRFSNDVEEKAKAKDLHPKLLAGMFFFFALGATGGITSLLTSDRPILESPHAVTGLIGLTLLTIQTILPTLFEGNPGLRNVHGILGSGIMTLFLVHAALGLQLGLSY